MTTHRNVGKISVSPKGALWTLSDFSSLPQISETLIESPYFTYGNRRCKFYAYPNGSLSSLGWFGIAVCSFTTPEKVIVELGITNEHQEYIVSSRAEQDHKWYRCPKLIRCTDFYSRKNEIMPRGNLHILLRTVSKMEESAVHTVQNKTEDGHAASTAECNLASIFKCPGCLESILPQIFQCQQGHLLCKRCSQTLTCCPSCQGPIGKIRNLAMEKVAATVFFPCKFSQNGCKKSLMHTEKADHEKLCIFSPYTCPCPGRNCNIFGLKDTVIPRLLDSQKSITTLPAEHPKTKRQRKLIIFGDVLDW